ncbi:hypothetical protein [Clostridium kluyveri]|uniref:Uncharacterized protein n=1 Tax=Clostridium kluyveri TaxID=1534 RepID=A0A1L5F658_CLOKL|nr:hypothetical protein [Clostridium kluyveri]APM38463.1 hypothetical protein BS101_06780 [Clostridium kluyveri]UZQ50746.1 hypothetical protein OP486_00805 [Clostridium kluyveri]
MLDMMRCICKICGRDIRKLISSIILTAIDTILSMAMLGMVLMTLVSLAAGSFDKKFLNKASADIISVLDEKPLPYRTSKPHFDNYGITLDNVFSSFIQK